jgi:hypothetical protein
MDVIFHVSPVFRILLVFFLILLLNRVRVPLGIALVFGGILIDFWAAKSFAEVGLDFFQSLAKPELWLLVINITLILEFG